MRFLFAATLAFLLVGVILASPAGAHPPTDVSTIVHRVNVGGPSLPGTPAWQADSLLSPSPFGNGNALGVGPYSTVAPIDLSHPSVPAGTPQALFQTERWDAPELPNLHYGFPVTPGRYDVHLYFAEIFTNAMVPGARQMDVTIEGSQVLDNYDAFVDAGAGNRGVVKEFDVMSDGTLDVELGHVVQNPAIKAIEIVRVAPSQAAGLVATPSPLAFGNVLNGQSKLLPVTLTNNGAAGTSPITVDATAIGGAQAGDFTDSFDDAANVTLQPGQSTTVTVTFAPKASGARAGTLSVTHSGSTTALSVPLSGTGTTAQSTPVAFGKGKLAGKSGFGPTTLQWGPDGRLYVGYFDGTIRAYTIARSAANAYAVTATETINLIKAIPNHDDNGVVNTSLTTRLLTGLVVTGSAASPVLYVSSSDPRIGGGPERGDLNLDTNGSTISRLTRTGSTWNRLEVVRGLPRSEENHAANGLALDAATNTLYVAQGGNTNRGAPSNNFAFLPEFAYSAAILSVNLGAIGNTTYDLPTLDDEGRPGTVDAGDPFGGNDGRNQARIVAGSPVQVHSPGYRNPYDVAITAAGRMFTIDNGGNAGWGNTPSPEGPTAACTNATSEPGVTDLDALHLVAAKGYYGGHPNPTRARTQNTFNTLAPQSPVAAGNPVECDHRKSGTAESTALTTFPGSTNGLAEYTASNFGGAMKGDLVTAAYNRNEVLRLDLNAAGTGLSGQSTIGSALGQSPLDVTAVGDSGPFPGTIWATDEATGDIHVLEPADYASGGPPPPTCTGADSTTLDEDGDGYDNADELDAGTSPCSGADTPADFDNDKTSDVTDTDDDNDARPDTSDAFAVDAQNGTSRSLPVEYLWENDGAAPGGLLNLGFTGLMSNGSADYRTLYDIDKLTAGGAAGVLTLDEVGEGDATGAVNTQTQAFQFGVDADSASGPFTARTRIVAPFGGLTATGEQSMGLQIGAGTQDDYLKVVATATGAKAVKEIAGVATTVGTATFAKPSHLDLYLGVNRTAHTAQAFYALPGGAKVAIGPATAIPADWTDNATRGLAVGIVSTSVGAAPVFPATWDFLTVTVDPVTPPPGGTTPIARDDFGRTVSGGWGSADVGGAWSLTGGAASFAVAGSQGTIETPAGAAQRMATLGGSLRDQDVAADLSVAATPAAGGGVFGYLLLRTQSGGPYYRVGLNFGPGGALAIRGQNHTGTALWSDVAAGTFAPGERIRLRVQADGAAPTTIRARAWKAGTTEPSAWQVVTTDNSAGPQTAGGVGVRTVNTTAVAAQVRVDGFVAQPVSGGTTPPPPPPPTGGTWHARPVTGAARQEVSYVEAGGKLYLAGGTAQHEEFDPATGTWRFIRPLPVRMDHIQGVAVGGKILYIGGLTAWPGPSVSTVWIYDIASDTFTQGAPMPAGRGRGAGGVAVHNGRVYYAGGLANSTVVPWFDVYDPATNTWTALPDMPRARDHFQGAVLNGRFHAIGGRAREINATITAHDAYDFSTGQWVTGLAPLPTARGGFGVGVVGGEIFVIGGEGNNKTYDEVEAYVAATNTWKTYPPMPNARHGIQAAVCGNGLWIAAGGLTQGGGGATNLHHVLYPGTPGTCGGGSPPPPPPPPPGSALVQDSFSRTVSGGWGSAVAGGAWSLLAGAASNLSVDGSKGVVVTPGDSSQQLTALAGTSVRDVDYKGELTVPAGANAFGYLVARRQASGAYYRVGLGIGATGNVFIRTQNATATIVPDVQTGLAHAPGNAYTVRVQLQGASPTQIRARVWRAGTPEPTAWQLVASDSALGPQVAGALGVRTVNLSGAATSIRVDDLLATALTTSGAAMRASIAGASSASPGEDVVLRATADGTPEDFDVTYAWDLDGDGIAEAFGERATASLADAGRHEVGLRAIASDGTAAAATKTIVVGGGAGPVSDPPAPSGPAAPGPAAEPVSARSPGHGSALGRSLRITAPSRVSLRSAIARGVAVGCRSDVRCVVELRLPAATAKRLRLPRVIGRAVIAGGRTGRLRLTARAARALRADGRRVTATLRATSGRVVTARRLALTR